MTLTADSVVGLSILVVCWCCRGKRDVPHERHLGEMIPCPICNGSGATPYQVTLAELRELLEEVPHG